MWVNGTIEACDFKGAKRGDCIRCAAARSVSRLLKPEWVAGISGVDDADGAEVVIIPVEAKNSFEDMRCNEFSTTPIKAPVILSEFASTYDHSKPGKPPKAVQYRINIPKRFLRGEVA